MDFRGIFGRLCPLVRLQPVAIDSVMDQRVEFLTYRKLAARFGVHRTTIVRWVERGLLPQPIFLAANRPLFCSGEIDAWLDRLIKIRDENHSRTCVLSPDRGEGADV